jgi:hypothetical protein
MAKNNKSAAEAAAAVAASEKKRETKILTPKQVSGLTQGEKVMYLNAVQKEREFVSTTSENVPEAIINGYSLIAQATIVDIGLGEIAAGSTVGLIISGNATNYALFAETARAIGMNLPDYKTLPAPTEEQLAQMQVLGLGAGRASDGEKKVLMIGANNVNKEAIEKKKKENEVKKVATLDPTKIENEEQLKEQLTKCFLEDIAPTARIKKAIDFYNSYLTIQATKAENKEEELAKVKAMSRIDMLHKITTIIGNATCGVTALAQRLMNAANETKSPISSFCLYKAASVKAGEKADDAFIADVVKTMIVWVCENKIAELESCMEASKKKIEEQNASKKPNKTIISTEQSAISYNENEIVGIRGIIDIVTKPSFSVVSTLEANYDGDKDSIAFKNAHRLVDTVIGTFYARRPNEFTKDSVLATAKQHAGIILNLFCDPLSQSIEFKDTAVPELVEKPKEEKPAEKKEDEKPAEESKN